MAICSSCGGSGIQRINDEQFRTCLICLGLGVVATTDIGTEARLEQPLNPAINAAASSVAAR